MLDARIATMDSTVGSINVRLLYRGEYSLVTLCLLRTSRDGLSAQILCVQIYDAKTCLL